MLKIVLEVEGMRCGMCETHVNDVVRRVEGVKKVASSHAKGRAEVIAEDGVDIARIKAAIAAQGYTVGNIQSMACQTGIIRTRFSAAFADFLAQPKIGWRGTARTSEQEIFG